MDVYNFMADCQYEFDDIIDKLLDASDVNQFQRRS